MGAQAEEGGTSFGKLVHNDENGSFRLEEGNVSDKVHREVRQGSLWNWQGKELSTREVSACL